MPISVNMDSNAVAHCFVFFNGCLLDGLRLTGCHFSVVPQYLCLLLESLESLMLLTAPWSSTGMLLLEKSANTWSPTNQKKETWKRYHRGFVFQCNIYFQCLDCKLIQIMLQILEIEWNSSVILFPLSLQLWKCRGTCSVVVWHKPTFVFKGHLVLYFFGSRS